jgi:two-component system phosphate regulon response regulator OmpR
MATRLLMIEDDHRLAALVRDYLTSHNLQVTLAETAHDGMLRFEAQPFDLVILDLMLPDGDGLDVCRRIRSTSNVAVLMLTAKGDPTDRIVGLEIGADDYLPKPFEPRELLARIKAVLRRGKETTPDQTLRFGRLEIDLGAREVRLDNIRRELTSHQFEMLTAMAERAGRVLTREQIMDLVRGELLEAFDRSIDVHIARIRAAIEDDPKHPKRVITVRGAGSVFAKVQDD